MAHQSPMISIPKKGTDEVDWTTPIRTLISQSYGENPDNYATECAQLQRCRQDAVRGAGSDLTARDLLYKYFGQLELLELRFSEIRVNFPWRDAFTSKLTTQTSIAFEKASILFQIASTHSAIAASQSRSDPEGVKRSFHYFRTCAGMLTYINENFLHAPSTDLSREVIKFLVSIILAQATEVFFEKSVDEKKGNALVAKIGAQAAAMYTALTEEVKEFMGKGIFDRNWVTLIQIKAKYFTSLSHYYRGLADNTASKHGDALVRYTLAETHAKEAHKLASAFNSGFVPNMSPQLPADAGPSISERTKAHMVLCTERKAEAQRENDLIYNAILPAPEALPIIDKANVATPVHIHEVYNNPEVQKTIGPDFFIRLVPLSVHESASVYSEEKAKLVRGEVEKAEGAEGEARGALESLGVREGLARFKAMAEGEVSGGEELPIDVRRWKEDIALVEDRESVDGILKELNRLKDGAQRELESISRDLEIESKDCEMMRVKYDDWTQAPSAGLTKTLRQDLKAHYGALEAAALSDEQVMTLWNASGPDIQVLLSPQVEEVFRASAGSAAGQHLLDLDSGSDAEDAKERAKIRGYVDEIEDRLSRISKISRERNEVLKDLKEKIQTDDVSHLLLLNRRNSGVEPTLFAAELEKFRPYQQRLAATIHHQEVAINEVSTLWKSLRDLAGRGPGARRWEDREKRKKDVVRRFSVARDRYMEVRDGLASTTN
ncbi:BRO1-domain-containing protein [Pluteus cervinus]|uniref:BRO1-domain-containing protein n=1 Tax=Pluteus cervinus TaxID=181527 RepID=A0ACD3BCX7_9AGAR|nr:BRO1-domain-containing protein [Pluteus cervinus]